MMPSARTPSDLALFIADHGLVAEILPVHTPTPSVVAAASALGVDPSQIVKSLLFMVGDQPILVIASGPSTVNRGVLANRHQVSPKQVRLANPREVVEILGYPVGGVPPFGHVRAVPALIDRKVSRWPHVFGGGGDEMTLVKISPSELARALASEWVDLD